MTMNPQDVMEDLAETESEGPADMFEDDFEMFESEMGEDGFEDGAELFESEAEWSMEDDFESEMEAEDFIGGALGSILGAEDEDEFLGKLFKGAKALIKKAAPIVGKIARGAAPILSAIPHPYAQIGSKVANVLGKLRAEGATTEDALEAVAEIAARSPRALPVVAGLATRAVLKNKAAQMPLAQRQQAAKQVTKAAKRLVAAGGPSAIRALPKIAQSVKRTAAARGVPASVRPRTVAQTAARVAQNPALLRKLSAPSPRGQALAQRAGGSVSTMGGSWAGGGRTFNVPGPATITISVR